MPAPRVLWWAWWLTSCLESGVHELTPLDPEVLAGRYRALSNSLHLVILVFGDAGRGGETQARVARGMARACAERGCDLALELGDNIYPAGVSGVDDPQFAAKFEEPYRQLGDLDFWLVLGNHDWRGDAQAEIDYTLHSDRWLMPATDYTVLGLPAWLTLVAFDSTMVIDSPALANPHFARTRARLCAGDGLRVLFAHHPAYANGLHGGDATINAFAHALARDCGPSVLLSGHDHDLELVRAGDLVQVVSGAAAVPRPVESRLSGTEFAAGEAGFALVTATPGTLRVAFFNADGELLYETTALHESGL